jgi:two-component system, LytTR family, response regulator
MSPAPLRIVVADDERPARRFLIDLLATIDGVSLVGEATGGEEALALIESERPDLALLDLQMPEVGGLDVVRQVSRAALPLVAFVTAFDDHAIEAFELNAIDYLLKPVEQARLAATITRARERLERHEPAEDRAATLAAAATAYTSAGRRQWLERIPVRGRDDVIAIVPVRQLASIVAERELLHLTTLSGERYTITHRLHALEARLDPRRFVRLGRSALASIDAIVRISPMPGGTSMATLSNGQELPISRIQGRVLRETMLKL